jgi:hypothetical protein
MDWTCNAQGKFVISNFHWKAQENKPEGQTEDG